ncbi:hypothetical protein LJR175_008222 [Variovorax sp. LjRoot175]|uniref:hypothetical protein n=1 Tax=Variovorax sp. LjRoot175 TaxID=3342276 RepID=UPI003ECE6F6C
MDKRAELIGLVVTEIDRIFGSGGFDGEPGQYEWLLSNYGVSEFDDVQWQMICEWERGEFGEGMDYTEEELAEREGFLADEPAVIAFLEELLIRYRSGATSFPRQGTTS